MAYRGETITLPVGLQGFNGSQNPSQLQPGHMSYVEGVDIDGGILVKDGGAQKLNSSALNSGASIIAGINWNPAGDNHDVIMLSDGDVLKDTGAGTFGTTLTSGLSAPTIFNPFFVTAGGEAVGETPKLFLFSEANQVQVVEGAANSMAAIADPPTDWASSFPVFGVQHSNRLWGGGNSSDPHRMYYSMLTDHGDFVDATAGTLAVYPGEGRQLVGGISFNGVLIVWKYPKGIYVIDTRNSDKAEWSVTKLSGAVGGSSPQTIFPIGNDILFLSPGGSFHLLSAVNQFGDVRTSDIGQVADINYFMRKNISLLNIRKAQGLWYPSRGKAWFMMPSIGATQNDRRMILDFNEATFGARFFISRRDTGISAWPRPDTNGVEKPTLGDNAGFVWLMDDEERNKDSVAYTMELESADDDFSFADPTLANVRKNGQFLELTVDTVVTSSLNVVPIWDGIDSQPIVFDIGAEGSVLGSFILDTDELASSGTQTIRRKLDGSGRRLKLRISNEVLDDEVRIANIKVAFARSDEAVRTG